jgi:hypothetical protein
MSRNGHARRTARIGFRLEHPRPHALRRYRLSSPPAGEPTDHRQVKGSAGEASLVREPIAGEASSCANFIFFRIQPLKDFTLALVIIGNKNDVQKRENSTNHAANKH